MASPPVLAVCIIKATDIRVANDMLINEYIVGGQSYLSYIDNLPGDSYCLEIEFKSIPSAIIFQLDKILEKLLDENYVLQSSNAQNRQIEKIDRNKKNFKIGNNWHTDSRYVNNKRISNGFSYLVIVALEDFTRNTASTQFIKVSFKRICSRPFVISTPLEMSCLSKTLFAKTLLVINEHTTIGKVAAIAYS